MHDFWGALTQQRISISWGALGKYNCTDLMSGDSGSLGLQWPRVSVSSVNKSPHLVKGLGLAYRGAWTETLQSFSRWGLSGQ